MLSEPSNSKRPRENSASQNDESESGSIAVAPQERQKVVATVNLFELSLSYVVETYILKATMHSTETLTMQIRSAFDIRRAISEVTGWNGFGSIGYSVTKMGKHKRPTPGQQVRSEQNFL